MTETTQEPRKQGGRPDSDGERHIGARTRDGTPCRKFPLRDADRCRFHGGASTGPQEPAIAHLEGNDHAVGNDGGAPDLNTNAEIHGGFSDWEKVYERLDDDRREWVDQLANEMRERAAEHAPDVDAVCRRRQVGNRGADVYRNAGAEAAIVDLEEVGLSQVTQVTD